MSFRLGNFYFKPQKTGFYPTKAQSPQRINLVVFVPLWDYYTCFNPVF
jgi:hypothetical protein